MLTKLLSLFAVVRLVRVWWSTRVDHSAQVAYFAHRGLLEPVQLVIGGCTVLIGVIPVISAFSPVGPGTWLTHAVSLGLAASTVPWALRWWLGRWPPRWCSIAFIVYADLGIVGSCLLYSDPLPGMFGLITLSMISVYIQFFECPRIFALHLAWTMIAICVFAVLVGAGPEGDRFLAAAKALASAGSLVALPVVIQLGIWLLHNDASDSINDHLTGLLNRRGLALLLPGRLREAQRPPAAHVMVLVIDLDCFKHVNDTFGHLEGDLVLIHTARRIQSAMPEGALIARVGGDEYIAMDVVAPHDAAAIAERVCAAIAAHAKPVRVTASVGFATIALDDVLRSPSEVPMSMKALHGRADEAMFEAKRRGGNTVVYTKARPVSRDEPDSTAASLSFDSDLLDPSRATADNHVV